LFESRSSTPGGVFWAPLPPCPLPPRGSGFPQGSMLPPGARGLHGSELPALCFQGTRLLGFFLASRPASRLSGFQGARLPGAGVRGFHASKCQGLVSGHPLYFPHCFHGTGGQGQAFRCPGFLYAFILSGGQGQGFQAFRRPCGQAFRLLPNFTPCFHAFRRLPGGRLPDFLASSMLSGGPASWRPGLGFQGTGDQGPGPGLPALRALFAT
jgi:hypothetical protein